MQELTIEKGMSPPKQTVRYAYPFEEMEVGDSFCVPVEGSGDRQKVLNACYRASKKLGWKFQTRKVEDGVRVWRIG